MNSTPPPKIPFKTMALIPCYKEEAHIAPVVSAVLAQGVDPVVIDDGSPDRSGELAAQAGAIVLTHPVNKGKGAATITGLRYATEHGYEAVILMDGDGQHAPEEIPRFTSCHAETGADVVLGTRLANAKNMPFVRYCTNHFMSWMLSRKAGQRIRDTQCGYRLLSAKTFATALMSVSQGFAAESEMLLRLAKAGFVFREVPVSTIYGTEKSKIHPVRDTIRFFRMLHNFR